MCKYTSITEVILSSTSGSCSLSPFPCVQLTSLTAGNLAPISLSLFIYLLCNQSPNHTAALSAHHTCPHPTSSTTRPTNASVKPQHSPHPTSNTRHANTAAKCSLSVLPPPAFSPSFCFYCKSRLRHNTCSPEEGAYQHLTRPQHESPAGAGMLKGYNDPSVCLLCTYPDPQLQLPGKWPWQGPLCLLGASL